MVFGEELHTGGKALESDILSKKIEFFKTLSEHVKIIGDRNMIAGSVQASSTNDVYTVPTNKLYFLFSISIDDRNIGAGNRRSNLAIKGESPLLGVTSISGAIANVNMVFDSPIILREGEVLTLSKNNTNTGHEVNVSILGYEVNKEISIQ